jgi:GTP cyclohydrolase I
VKSANQPSPTHALPDVVSHERPVLLGALDWVGMDGIALPLQVCDGDGVVHRAAARVAAWVNLPRAEDRGIHMSRLYRALDRHLAERAPDAAQLRALLQDFLDSHAGQSDRARVRLRFEISTRRDSLRSGLSGWRSYPVDIAAELDRAGLRIETEVRVEYASTCPGSAALARQLIQQRFDVDFGQRSVAHSELREWLGSPHGICATPHAQRSLATVKLRCSEDQHIAPLELIDRIEAALGTPLQAAVKREDEQEFARLNGAHPMYCEDAARRIRAALEALPNVADYSIRAAHLESLHPHDAVAVAVRGVLGGFIAQPD